MSPRHPRPHPCEPSAPQAPLGMTRRQPFSSGCSDSSVTSTDSAKIRTAVLHANLWKVVPHSGPQLHAICTQARLRAVTVLATTSHPLPRLAAAPSVLAQWGHPTPSPSMGLQWELLGLTVEPLRTFLRGRPSACVHRRYHHGDSHHRRPTSTETGAPPPQQFFFFFLDEGEKPYDAWATVCLPAVTHKLSPIVKPTLCPRPAPCIPAHPPLTPPFKKRAHGRKQIKMQ